MKKKWIPVIIIVVILAAAAGIYLSIEKGIDIDAADVSRGEIKSYIEETGTVKSKKQRVVSTNITGRIADLKYEAGDEVKEGDVLLTFDMEAAALEIKSLESKLSGLMPSYEQSKRNLENSKKLYDQGALSYEEYQNAITLKKQFESQISEIQYSIQQLKETKGYGEIRSPITGVVTEIYVQEGETILGGSPLLEVADLNDLYIEVKLLTNEANRVSLNALVTIINEDLGILMEQAGYVGKIYPKAESSISDLGIEQKRVTVDIYLDSFKNLKLGYDVDVKILEASKLNVLIIPENAIFESNGKEYVFIVQKGIAVLKEVKTGLSDGENVEIAEGLSEGETVIVSPGENIKEGTSVKLKTDN
ncbi:MAG: efflux RND transporter periplasmic adaptor subunit [Clostridiales bacterium]|nr:efflux RND transporter periplasmic adaptor subunit [Clostridiales bacterium]